MFTIYLPIANIEVSGAGLAGLGLIVGFLAGMFGVGGGFLMTPMLNILFRIPFNIAVGSGLAQILGTSISGTTRHKKLGNIDYKLAFFMLLGSLPGVELGARLIQKLRLANPFTIWGREINPLDFFVPLAYIILLLVVGTLIFRESRVAKRRPPRGGRVDSQFALWVRHRSWRPLIHFHRSQIKDISIWIVLLVAFFGGVLAGFLGVGGGFIVTPALIYLIGVPTAVAIGTSLFQTIFIAGYGAFTHALKGNVDPTLVVFILAGGLLGVQFGATLTRKLRAAHLRYIFSLFIYLAAAALILKFAGIV